MLCVIKLVVADSVSKLQRRHFGVKFTAVNAYRKKIRRIKAPFLLDLWGTPT